MKRAALGSSYSPYRPSGRRFPASRRPTGVNACAYKPPELIRSSRNFQALLLPERRPRSPWAEAGHSGGGAFGYKRIVIVGFAVDVRDRARKHLQRIQDRNGGEGGRGWLDDDPRRAFYRPPPGTSPRPGRASSCHRFPVPLALGVKRPALQKPPFSAPPAHVAYMPLSRHLGEGAATPEPWAADAPRILLSGCAAVVARDQSRARHPR